MHIIHAHTQLPYIKKQPVLNLRIEDCEYLSQDKNNWTMVLNCIQHIQTRVTEIDSNHRRPPHHIQHHPIIHPD